MIPGWFSWSSTADAPTGTASVSCSLPCESESPLLKHLSPRLSPSVPTSPSSVSWRHCQPWLPFPCSPWLFSSPSLNFPVLWPPAAILSADFSSHLFQLLFLLLSSSPISSVHGETSLLSVRSLFIHSLSGSCCAPQMFYTWPSLFTHSRWMFRCICHGCNSYMGGFLWSVTEVWHENTLGFYSSFKCWRRNSVLQLILQESDAWYGYGELPPPIWIHG